MSQKNKHTDVDKESLRLEYCFEKGLNFKDRIIQITGNIEERVSFDYLDAALTEMERGCKKAITIKINSPGGSVYEALAMVDRIKDSKCQIITKCYGHAMSAASLILAAGDKRLMGSRAWVMHHEFTYNTGGSHTENKETIFQVDKELSAWAESLAEFTNQPKDFWLAAAHKHDFYLDALECLELGLVDELF